MMKKRIMLIASTLVVTAFALTKLHTVTAYAVEGWMSEDGEWSYLDENDEPLQNTWRQSRFLVLSGRPGDYAEELFY